MARQIILAIISLVAAILWAAAIREVYWVVYAIYSRFPPDAGTNTVIIFFIALLIFAAFHPEWDD